MDATNIASSGTTTSQEEPETSHQGLSGISALFKSAVGLLKQHFWKYIGVVFLVSIAWIALNLTLGTLTSIMSRVFSDSIITVEKFFHIIEYAENGFFALFLISCFTAIAGNNAGVFESFKISLRRSLSLIALLILTWIVWAVSLIPEIAGTLLNMFEYSAAFRPIFFLITIVSFLFFIVSSIYISQAPFALAAGRDTAMNALKKSYYCVRDRWFSVLFRLILLSIIVFAIAFGLLMLSLILIAFSPAIGAILFFLILFMTIILFAPFCFCYGYALYNDLLVGQRPQETEKTPVLLQVAMIIGTFILLITCVLFFQGTLVTDEEWLERQTESALPFFDQAESIIDD